MIKVKNHEAIIRKGHYIKVNLEKNDTNLMNREAYKADMYFYVSIDCTVEAIRAMFPLYNEDGEVTVNILEGSDLKNEPITKDKFLDVQGSAKFKNALTMRRLDTCWFCGKEDIQCDITILKSGEEIPCCDKCYDEEKASAEHINPMDLI